MTKKYRTVMGKYPVRILCTDSNNEACPIVYEYCGPNMFGRDTWLVNRTSVMGTNLCGIEEVPEEPIKAGYSWTDEDGWYWRVAAEHPDGGKFLLIFKDPAPGEDWDVEKEYAPFEDYWYTEEHIRQASQT